MPELSFSHPHRLTRRTALERAHALAEELATSLEASYRWHEDTLHFERPGADGSVQVGAEAIEVEVRLSWLLSGFRGPIERQIRQVLARHFD